jgi:hypothetical protein
MKTTTKLFKVPLYDEGRAWGTEPVEPANEICWDDERNCRIEVLAYDCSTVGDYEWKILSEDNIYNNKDIIDLYKQNEIIEIPENLCILL